MGIDIYARWKGQSEDEIGKQEKAWLNAEAGEVGYLREPYATRYLCAEAFNDGDGAPIAAATLRKRLPRTLALAEERNRNLYHASAKETEKLTQSICNFVSLCEKKEQETGEPVRIMAWY